MKKCFPLGLLLVVAFYAAPISADIIHFDSTFDEGSLAATGMTADTPNTSGTNSGTVSYNAANESIDLTANSADMWNARDNAPIAYVASPTVAVGDTWYVETSITHFNSTGNNSTWDQAGMTFYNSNPAGNGDGSFWLGTSDWNGYAHSFATFGGGSNGGVGADTNIDTFYYRTEILENGATDTYTFLYKESAGAVWTQLGSLMSSVNNSRVGLFLKSHNNNTTASTSFNSLKIATISQVPEPSSTFALAGFCGVAFIRRRRRS
jgi:hypothetical protein